MADNNDQVPIDPEIEENEDSDSGEEEEDSDEDVEHLGVDHIPEDPAAALAEAKETFAILLGVMTHDATHESQARALQLDIQHNEKRAEAVAADTAGQRARAAQLYWDAERLKALWRATKQEFEDQQKVAGHRWLEDLFRRIRQLEGYTGLSPDPAIRFEGLRILHFVSPRLYLNDNDTLRVQAFFYRDPAEDQLNVGFVEDANGNNPDNHNGEENGMNGVNGAHGGSPDR